MIVNANCRHALPLASESVDMCVTSPPYWGLRDYGVAGQLGLEPTPEEFIANMVQVFREVRRVLKPEASLWVNIGDTYTSGGRNTHGTRIGYKQETNAGSMQMQHIRPEQPCGMKEKDLVGIPWMLAFALRTDGWYLRSDIIWAKPNPMPESVTDRPTKSHEYLFLLAKQPKYYYDADAVKEPSATGDMRRPYTSEGAWEMDGRPAEQRHGGELRKPRRSETFKRETKDHLIPGQSAIQHREGRADTYANGTRNRRTVWTIATEPTALAHFATFPQALVEPCVLAGTSAHGNCSVCGKPWGRVTEKSGGGLGKGWTDHDADLTKGMSSVKNPGGGIGAARDENGNPYTVTTTGWRPTCTHADAPTVAPVVLDVFAGSGTVGQVCRRHGRRFVGIDLNWTYLHDLALARAEGLTPAARIAELPLFQVSA